MEYLKAFLCGGVLCAIGQVLIDRTQLTPARILTGYVVAGVALSAVGLYQPIADWGGASVTRWQRALPRLLPKRAGWAFLPAVSPPLPAESRRPWFSAY